MIGIGAVGAWWLGRHSLRRTERSNILWVREVAARLGEVAVGIKAGVGHHHDCVKQISEELVTTDASDLQAIVRSGLCVT